MQRGEITELTGENHSRIEPETHPFIFCDSPQSRMQILVVPAQQVIDTVILFYFIVLVISYKTGT